MNNNFINWAVGGNWVATLVILGLLLFGGGAASQKLGSTTQTNLSTWAPAVATSFVGTNGVESDQGFFDAAGGVSEFLGSLAFSSNTTTHGAAYQGIASTCSTASSTLFAVQNPFSATSTLVYASLQGTQGATTTDILIATSTSIAPATGLAATSTLGANILNLAAIATSTQFYSVAGVSLGSNVGYNNPKGIPSSVSNQEVVVGPTEYVLGFSTSTTLGSGNGATGSTQVAIPKSCTYKLLFIK